MENNQQQTQQELMVTSSQVFEIIDEMKAGTWSIPEDRALSSSFLISFTHIAFNRYILPKLTAAEQRALYAELRCKDLERANEGLGREQERILKDNRKILRLAEDKELTIQGLQSRIQELEAGIQSSIDWMKEHRPHLTGTGAPILMLTELLKQTK